MTSWVQVRRGGCIESQHRIHVAVAHAQRGLVASTGDPSLITFVRSAIKMFQALPLVEDRVAERCEFTREELALCTASHNAEPFHVETARRILTKAGADEEALACGPHAPMHPGAAQALIASGAAPTRVHNNCSGKHAGMIALARHHGWPLDGYHRLEHPVQQRVLGVMGEWSGVDPQRFVLGTDGCGLPTFALPLDAVALACARFAAAADAGEAAARVFEAMTSHPEYVAGTDRLCTDLMRVTRGLLFAKVGAEGYYCVGVPRAQVGIALKVEDGARRAVEPALLSVLSALHLVSDAELATLDAYAHPVIRNTRGEAVGDIRAEIQLTARGQ